MNHKIILIASFGAAMLELIDWYELRKHLQESRYRKLLRSTAYWVVVIVFILVSGVATWIWYGAEQSGQMSREAREYLLVGAAIPLLLKRAISSIGSSGGATLGADEGSVWKDYFRIK